MVQRYETKMKGNMATFFIYLQQTDHIAENRDFSSVFMEIYRMTGIWEAYIVGQTKL